MHNDDLALKARIDERVIHKTNNIQMSIELMHKDMEELDKKTALMGKDIDYIKKDSGEIKALIKGMSGIYATKQEHQDNKNEIKEIKKDTEEFKKFIYKFSGAILVIVPAVTFALQKFYTSLLG